MILDMHFVEGCSRSFPVGTWRLGIDEVVNSTGIVISPVDSESFLRGVIISRPGMGDELLQDTVIGSMRELHIFLKHAFKSHVEESEFIVGMESEFGVTIDNSTSDEQDNYTNSLDTFFTGNVRRDGDFESVTFRVGYGSLSCYTIPVV